jgi:hypothetical protein
MNNALLTIAPVIEALRACIAQQAARRAYHQLGEITQRCIKQAADHVAGLGCH